MSRILNSAFVWIGSATHDTSDAFRQRQRERIRRMQNNDAGGGEIKPQSNGGQSLGGPPKVDGGSTRVSTRTIEVIANAETGPASPHSPFARKEGKS